MKLKLECRWAATPLIEALRLHKTALQLPEAVCIKWPDSRLPEPMKPETYPKELKQGRFEPAMLTTGQDQRPKP